MSDANHENTAMFEVNDENAIRSLLARLHEAWSRGDADGYAACFTANADYITFNGMHLRGRAENADLHDALFRSVLKNTKLSAEIEGLELLSSGIALVHTMGSGRKKSHQCYVLVKSNAGWLIRSFQNTRVQPFSILVTRCNALDAKARQAVMAWLWDFRDSDTNRCQQWPMYNSNFELARHQKL
jgi:uncharacterized protein (TIGR02246 family)